MTTQLQTLRKLYTDLILILESQKDDEISVILASAKESLSIIDDYLNQTGNPKTDSETRSKLTFLYKTINQPRVGLSDYFIWRDLYDDRVQANQPLDEVKSKLNDFFLAF